MTKTPFENLLANKKFRDFIEAFQQVRKDTEHLPLDEVRKLSTKFFLDQACDHTSVERIENQLIKSQHGHYIPIRIFTPHSQLNLPVLIYLHRGGWVFGNIEEADSLCRKLSYLLNCIVVSVDYRLAPEHPFPDPLEDCYEATCWIAEQAIYLGGNPKQLIICGESAGGNLAAAVTLMARDRAGPKIKAQLLIYPAISSQLDESAYQSCPDQYFLTKDSMNFFWSTYLQSPNNYTNPYASLDLATNLSNLPPAIIVTAEYDPLECEAQAYAKRLKDANVPTLSKSFPKLIHGFLDLPIYEEEQKQAWILEIKELLNTFK